MIQTASLIITALATVAIAYYSWCSYKLAMSLNSMEKSREEKEQEFRQQLSDLYQALVIANLLGGQSIKEARKALVEEFKKMYKGTTPIHLDLS